ncbi:LytTR family DNA-binding domain-containing protein [Spirosoma panaciterrae]|uniref:LytTR family DNA-binding domain-containing protein n=1 Tax=Spirosoma panaciterrae TaxID=496058 RepID=UPI00036406A6|nr:LytTR family DNA-binding domain-containing protein [Spirosoma panaciterrae]
MKPNVYRSAKGAQFRTAPAKILYLMGDINYCRIYLNNGQTVLMSRTLKWYAARLPGFTRIHKRALINPTYARALQLSVPVSRYGYVCMDDQAVLPIARRRLALIQQELAHLPVQKLAYRLTTNR